MSSSCVWCYFVNNQPSLYIQRCFISFMFHILFFYTNLTLQYCISIACLFLFLFALFLFHVYFYFFLCVKAQRLLKICIACIMTVKDLEP